MKATAKKYDHMVEPLYPSINLSLQTFMLGMILAHDAFMIMDKIGNNATDMLAFKWRKMADAGGLAMKVIVPDGWLNGDLPELSLNGLVAEITLNALEYAQVIHNNYDNKELGEKIAMDTFKDVTAEAIRGYVRDLLFP